MSIVKKIAAHIRNTSYSFVKTHLRIFNWPHNLLKFTLPDKERKFKHLSTKDCNLSEYNIIRTHKYRKNTLMYPNVYVPVNE